MKNMNRKSVTFTILVVWVLLVAIYLVLYFIIQLPEYIQGEAEAVEVRISGKVPGRIERFMCNEGDRVKAGGYGCHIGQSGGVGKIQPGRKLQKMLPVL